MATVPEEADRALAVVGEQFAESLVAVYLYGSAVAGGLRPRSDVDLLVVIDQPMATEARKSIAADLMRVSGHFPSDPEGRRPIELIVFLRADMTAIRYPARSEFIYGEWLRHEMESGEPPGPARDPEFTLLLAQARQQSLPLVGPNASELLPAVPRSDIRRAIGDALPVLIEGLEGDERNVLLTLARMWRTLVTGEFVPKDIAAGWAASRLPAEPAAILADARDAYLGVRDDDLRERQQQLRRTVHSLRDCVLRGL